MADQTWRSRGGLMLAGGVALGGLLLTSCALPGTTAPVGNISTVHIAGVAAVAAPPTIAVSPSNSAQGVGLDAPVLVTVTTGHLDTVSLSESGSSTALPGVMSPDGRSWEMSQSLDQGAHYTVVATATSTAGSTSTSTSTFATVTARSRLLTGMTPLDGAVVGVGETIDLRFNTSIPAGERAALLERIQVTSTPAVMGGWHWLTANVVHFRPATFWASGTKVTVTANLKGFDAGNGIWGLGDWTSGFSVGAKHLSIINNSTHTMQVFNNDKLIATYPVSLGKGGFPTIQGTLIVLYKTPVVVMKSCPTFHTPAACIPGGSQYYNDPVYEDTAISTSGYFIHAAPWSVGSQGRADVSHGCVNLSNARATQYYNFSIPGDVVQVENTGYNATYSDGEGDWQLSFATFSNTAGLGPVWTGPVGTSSLPGQVS
ncbi:MAG TPA: Ig-like domain-containing protein [Candidatus Saccharimonadales bacterium]|nr:Ig-like domain-containing protein [Candidatus Saccharimonadales bacterium]